jgi:hypothetical protein
VKAALAFAAGLTLACAAAAPALAAPSLIIRDAAVSVAVVPEARSDIAVEVWRPNPGLALDVRRQGADVVIDGHLPQFLSSCHGSGAAMHVFIFPRGDFALAQMPQVLVHAPLDAVIESGGFVHGVVARSQSLTLNIGGCGDWTVANVAGAMSANVAGVGDVRTGASRSAEVGLSGTGHLSVGRVQTQLVAHLSGAGSLSVREAGAADLSVSGTGGLTTGPIAGPLSVRLSGAGSLKTASVGGPVIADVSGVGNVMIEGGHAPSLGARVSGTGNIAFRGVADTLDASVSGVGSIEVARVTGSVSQHVSGIGSVHIDATGPAGVASAR